MPARRSGPVTVVHSRMPARELISAGEKAGRDGPGLPVGAQSSTDMELKTTLLMLLMLMLVCLLMCAEAEAARPGGPARPGGRPRVRAGAQGRPRPRGRVKGHKRGPVRVKSHLKVGKPVVHTKEPERTPVYLEVAGEAHPIPVYPLAPGSGHQPFTVRVASPHLADDPAPSSAGAGASAGSSTPFQPSQPVSFDASDASRTSSADGLSPLPPVSPASSPESQLNSFGSSFFDTSAGFGDGFSRAPSRFPDFDTTFQGSRSRRRGARKLFPPTFTAQAQSDGELSHANGKTSFTPSTGTLDEYLDDQPLHSSYSDLNSDPYSDSNLDSDSDPDSDSEDQYQFGYLVDGRRESGAAFGLQQSAADGVTRGRYEVQLPDGRTQVVTYTAGGERGYEAEVSYVERTHPAAPTAAAATVSATVVEGTL